MGHINAAIEWFVHAFNDIWPLVMATFIGAWLAFQHIKHYERRKELESRNRAGQFAYFVLSSQRDRLRSIVDDVLSKFTAHPRRAFVMEPVVIHEDYPRLDMTSLPAAFDAESFALMNEVIAAEQRFIRITTLLNKRVECLDAYERVKASEDPDKALKSSIKRQATLVTDKVYSEVDDAQANLDAFLPKLAEAVQAFEDQRKPADLVDYFSWSFLAGSVALIGIFFFSHWAVNMRSVDLGLDISLVSALVFAVSLYASLALCFVAGMMSVYSMTRRLKSFGIYFWTMIIALQPTLFLLWMDAS